ncbi:aminopeptidase P family protein [Blastococcus sp. MG754426]|uniref:M24 family metallopeptidase n=1 Tax=unclassified Blastococcus TaxID=2619396 RepID=UPI001EF13971|nr:MULTISPECIES: Xaa-Pro peptidase family protein [unclassified Blastococcus]MCF6508104.1 aminopeptidase P family protein [Blastococcus sp. MG754426]MCF6511567.1 aminopeptidase P family protein [Blastococcus sp. MG754427]
MIQHDERRRRLSARMEEAGVDLVFLPPSADLEYFTGMERRVPTFGEVAYTHHWVAGAFFAPGREPVFVLPRMIREFDLPNGVPGEVVTVAESDDADTLFRKAAGQFGRVGRVAVGKRTWAETVLNLGAVFPDSEVVDVEPLSNGLRRIKSAEELELMTRACAIVDQVMAGVEPKVRPGVTELEIATEVAYQMKVAGSRAESFDTAVWSMGPLDDRDATVRISTQPLREGMGVSFDFGSVVQGYCSDFGRTVHVGEPGEEYLRVHELVMASQQAGIDASRPGATAAEVHEATRQVIVDGGYGEWFRHRTGHCIGLDVHEKPYISEEDDTPLEAGMTFTIEPSVFWPGRVGVRVEDVIVVEQDGARKLNEHPTTMVANA